MAIGFMLLVVLVSTLHQASADCMSCTTYLYTAYCWHLNLKSVPDCLFNTTRYLDLSDNSLTVLPSYSFRNYPDLQTLRIEYNQIAYLDSNVFEKLTNLTELSLYRNNLTTLPPNLFANNLNLKVVNLAFNKLVSIDMLTFQHLFAIETLRLQSNSIQEINSHGNMSFSASLIDFNLGVNKLERMDPVIISKLHGIDTYLDLNPWHCNCLTTQIIATFKKNNVTLALDPKCSSPKNLAGIKWSALKNLPCD